MSGRTTDNPHFPTTPAAEPGSDLDLVRAQVDRILASDTFRAAEVLRRLLRFLASKTFAGEADNLKEYSVGIDALGKPPSYDPGKDAIVRLQASRLRQKLDDYYRGEGRDDPFVVSLPKGRFKIAWHPRQSDTVIESPAPGPESPAVSVLAEQTPLPERENLRKWRALAIGFAAAAVLLAGLSIWSFYRMSRVTARHIGGASTPELDELWSPFLYSSHHLILGFSNPFFVRLQESGYRDIIYHTMGVNSWADATSSAELPALSRAMGNPKVTPTYNMVERSTLLSTFVLSRFLAGRLSDISLVRSSDVSWQQLADNDVILLTGLKLDESNPALPVELAFAVDAEGVRNLHPQPGEPALYSDPQDHQDSDGQGLELVSMLPGPLGRTSVITFSSNHAWGIICGVQALTDPSFVRVLTTRMKDRSAGKLPAYYQLVLRISYRDGTPVHASYVTHRILTIK